MFEKKIFINDELIKEKGKRLIHNTNAKLPNCKCVQLSFNNRWLTRFKKRSGLRCYKSHGEKADADLGAARECLTALRSFLQQFNPKNVFNADEFGLYYKQAPTSTIAQGRLPGIQALFRTSTFLIDIRTKI